MLKTLLLYPVLLCLSQDPQLPASTMLYRNGHRRHLFFNQPQEKIFYVFHQDSHPRLSVDTVKKSAMIQLDSGQVLVSILPSSASYHIQVKEVTVKTLQVLVAQSKRT